MIAAASAAASYFATFQVPGHEESLLVLTRLVCFIVAGVACSIGMSGGRGSALFMVCIGMWAGTAAAGTLLCHSRASFTGFPLRQVTGFFCIVREDSRLLADGRTRIPATLMTVSGRDGREADARGEVTIFVHSGVSFRQGERIKTSIPVIATERNRGGTDTSYLSFGGAGTLRSLGISDPLLRLRSTVLENIFRSTSGMGAAAGPLFRALFTGNQDTLDPAVVQLFRRSGCAHVLALSGMHLGILTALVGWFFSRILGRNAGYVLGLICVLIYLGVVGAKASLVRAGLMYAVAGYSVLRSRKPGGLATLALCFLIQLFCFPANGLTISFQLSYLALFGILLLAPTVVDALAPYITRGAAALVGAGVGAQLAVVPLVLVVFGTFYPVGIAAGILLGVLVTAFIWSGIVYLVVAGALPALTVYAAIVPQELEHIIVAVARIASHAPASSLPAPVAAAGCAAIAVFILHFRH